MWAVLFQALSLASEPALAGEPEDGPRVAAVAPGPSLRQRRVPGPLRRGIQELKDPAGWPAEPQAPEGPLDAARFDAAVSELCRPVAGRADLPEVARLVREAAGEAGADPFLVAALAYRQSRCRPALRIPGAVGLLGLQPAMFQPGARLPVPREALSVERLRDPAHNLRVGLALLAMWEAEHPALDRVHPGTPHRSGMAHFFWGDRVWGASAEDRVFTARRRLLELYAGAVPRTEPSGLGLEIVSPLDGVPRLGTSGPGADRDGGARPHRGLDIDATVGEPVRAIADGVVQFAGIDKPGRQPAQGLSPKRALKARERARLGPGGLFVRIVHADGLRSGYFHLSSYNVVPGQTVRAGEVIGAVGRSGIKVSGSHLHFELDRRGELLDPARALAAFVIPPEATLSHDYAMAEKRLRLARQKRVRKLARKRLVSEAAAPAPGAALAARF